MLSAESLLADPALFWRRRADPGGAWAPLHAPGLLLEYLDLAERHPVPNRMVRSHAFKILGAAPVLPTSACTRCRLDGMVHADACKILGAALCEHDQSLATCPMCCGVACTWLTGNLCPMHGVRARTHHLGCTS